MGKSKYYETNVVKKQIASSSEDHRTLPPKTWVDDRNDRLTVISDNAQHYHLTIIDPVSVTPNSDHSPSSIYNLQEP